MHFDEFQSVSELPGTCLHILLKVTVQHSAVFKGAKYRCFLTQVSRAPPQRCGCVLSVPVSPQGLGDPPPLSKLVRLLPLPHRVPSGENRGRARCVGCSDVKCRSSQGRLEGATAVRGTGDFSTLCCRVIMSVKLSPP